MRKELDYFQIENDYGGNQELFPNLIMKMGGCAAVTACDCCIYFDLYKGTKLYPYSHDTLTRKDYYKFGMKMKPYLHPRWTGIDKLEIYVDGFGKFLTDNGFGNIIMKPLAGETEVTAAKNALVEQIDKGLPIPCLMLNHKNKAFKDFEWHWFLLTGYEIFEEKCMVKVVSYGEWYWFDFDDLWNTGRERKGGLILFEL